MPNTDTANPRTIPVTELSFDRSPLFAPGGTFGISSEKSDDGCINIFSIQHKDKKLALNEQEFVDLLEFVPGHTEVFRMKDTGHAARIMFDATVTSPGHEDVQVKEGGVLYRSTLTGELTFHARADFNRDFERVLSNGVRVALSEPGDIQLRKIWAAGDRDHLREAVETFGVATASKALDLGADLLQRGINSQTAQNARGFASDLRTEAGAATKDLFAAGQEIAGTVQSRVAGALKSPTAQAIRSGLRNLTGWGSKSGEKPKP